VLSLALAFFLSSLTVSSAAINNEYLWASSDDGDGDGDGDGSSSEVSGNGDDEQGDDSSQNGGEGQDSENAQEEQTVTDESHADIGMDMDMGSSTPVLPVTPPAPQAPIECPEGQFYSEGNCLPMPTSPCPVASTSSLVDSGRLIFVADMDGTPEDSTSGTATPTDSDSNNCIPSGNLPTTSKLLTSPSTPPPDGTTTPSPPPPSTSGLQGLLGSNEPTSDNQPPPSSVSKEDTQGEGQGAGDDLIEALSNMVPDTTRITENKDASFTLEHQDPKQSGATGSTTTYYPDGKVIWKKAIGQTGFETTTTMLADGTWTWSISSGASRTLLPDGTEIRTFTRPVMDEDGHEIPTLVTRTEHPDGTLIEKDAKTGAVLHSSTTMPDGTIIDEGPYATSSTKLDGTEVIRWHNGYTETFRDGTRFAIDPKTGNTETTEKDGTLIEKDGKTGDTETRQTDGSTVKRDGKTGEIISTSTRLNDGTEMVEDGQTGDITYTQTDGTVVKRDGKTGEIVSTTKRTSDGEVTEKSDGSTVTEKQDGTWFITFPKKADGSQKTSYSDGREECKDTAGKIIPCK
jgi:hypothetical protein